MSGGFIRAVHCAAAARRKHRNVSRLRKIPAHYETLRIRSAGHSA
jgi:hypothetical protein